MPSLNVIRENVDESKEDTKRLKEDTYHHFYVFYATQNDVNQCINNKFCLLSLCVQCYIITNLLMNAVFFGLGSTLLTEKVIMNLSKIIWSMV